MSQPTNFPSSLSSSSHYFHRGSIQQSPTAYSSIHPSQGHTLYNGVLGSQSGFPSQNNFPTSNFNNFSHVDPPLWLPDTRVTSTVTNVPLISVGRSNRQLYPGKEAAANIQNVPQACCATQPSMQKNIGANIPLSSDAFKGFDKDMTFPVKGVGNIDPQSWYCGQSVVSYGNQQNQNVQQSYKCVEQFSSCLVAQNMLHEQSTTKQTNVSFSSGQNCSLEQKDEYCTKFSTRSMCLEQDKKQPPKYYEQNPQIYGPAGYTMHGKQSEQQQQECYSNQSVFGSSSEMCSPLSAEGLYSQASLFLHMNNDNQVVNRSQAQFSNQKPLHFSSFPDNCKSFSPSEGQLLAFQQFQEHDKSTADLSVTCGIGEGNVQQETKSVAAEVNSRQIVPDHRNYEHVTVVDTIDRCNNSYGVSELAQICSSGVVAAPQKQLCPSDCDDGIRNKETSSIAGESDIIVEETEEEDVSESEISVDEGIIKSRCLVCDIESANNQLVYVNKDTPLTSSSHTPVAIRLVQAVSGDELAFKFHSEFMCRRCVNLIETMDSLETKLTTVKHNIIQLFGPKLSLALSAQNFNCCDTPSIEVKEDTAHECKLDGQTSSFDDVDSARLSIHDGSHIATNSVVGIPEQAVAGDGGLDYNPDSKIDVEEKNCNGVVCNADEDGEETDKERTVNFSCETCGEYFCSQDYLSIHQQQHTKEYTHFCKECSRGFVTQHALDSHVQSHTGEFRFQCDICGKLFRQHYSLENHLHRHEGKFQFVCSVCAKGFVSKHALQIHLRLHTGDCPFMCEHCGRQFKCPSNLTVHIRSCSGELPYQCKKCNKKFTLRAHLHAHISTQHNNNARVKCTLCNKGFSKNSDLISHVKSHSKEKLHACKICGKCYSRISNLNQHSKIHFEDRLYKCDICTKQFKRKSTLIDHINQHKGLKLFECDSCKQTFVSQRSFQVHQKWHAGTLKRYTCKVCGKSMYSGLNVHMLTHTRQKPHSCLKCGALFSVKSSLNKHIRKHCKKL